MAILTGISRTSSTILATHTLTADINGTTGWTTYHNESIPPGNATYFDLRLTSDTPATGEAYAWFDDVHFIEWSDWASMPTEPLATPNDYYFAQLRRGSPVENPVFEYEETVYNEVQAVTPDFDVTETVALINTELSFQEVVNIFFD